MSTELSEPAPPGRRRFLRLCRYGLADHRPATFFAWTTTPDRITRSDTEHPTGRCSRCGVEIQAVAS